MGPYSMKEKEATLSVPVSPANPPLYLVGNAPMGRRCASNSVEQSNTATQDANKIRELMSLSVKVV
jgi:hypothetical protein